MLAALPVTKAGLNSKSEAGDLDAQPERDKVTDLNATSFFYTGVTSGGLRKALGKANEKKMIPIPCRSQDKPMQVIHSHS